MNKLLTRLVWFGLAGVTLLAQEATQPFTIVGRSDTGTGANALRDVVRFAEVKVDRQLFAPAPTQSDARTLRVQLPLLDGNTATVNFRVATQSERSASWIGKVENSGFGYATLAVFDDAVSAHLFLEDGRVFELAPADGKLFWRQIDTAALPTEQDDIRIPPSGAAESLQAAAPRALDNGTQIDVLVVYTPSALAARQSTASMNAFIEEAVAQANLAYSVSGIGTQLRLVGAQLVNYNSDATDPGSDHIGRLTSPTDGILDEVHATRSALRADLVSMMVSDSTCGVGWLKTNQSNAGREYGFSVVGLACAVSQFTFAHELGHNMGAVHDRVTSTVTGMFPYSYGIQQTAVTPYFRTVMAYPCLFVQCPRVGYFSNPNVFYQGIATGVAQSSPNSADVAATINQSRVWVSQYFDAAVNNGPTGLHFVPVSPCRVVDTRNSAGPFGGPSLSAVGTRDFPFPSSPCGIPSNARAYSLNVTVVPRRSLGFITLWAKGLPQPNVSTLNAIDGRVKANAAIVSAGDAGAITTYATDTVDLILDLNGYFVPENSTPAALAFYPVAPCRVADTRSTSAGALAGGHARNFPVRSACPSIPDTAQAYSLNATVVASQPLGYLSLWPTGEVQPFVSTLNAYQGGILANAAIIKAGAGGQVSAFASDNTHLILDINGYFAPPGATNAQRFFTLTPCRIVDTRDAAGTFGGPILSVGETRTWPALQSSRCVWPSAQPSAYLVNATAIPVTANGLGYLKLWAAGQSEPPVSTLNAVGNPLDPIVANAAIVGAGTSGSISGLAIDPTHLLIDVLGYFIP